MPLVSVYFLQKWISKDFLKIPENLSEALDIKN